jgi:hypothetical protein
MKTGSLLATIACLLFALIHMTRLVAGYEVIIAGHAVPLWVSVFGVILPLLVAWLLWKESK